MGLPLHIQYSAEAQLALCSQVKVFPKRDKTCCWASVYAASVSRSKPSISHSTYLGTGP
jgi:hypothetical protein